MPGIDEAWRIANEKAAQMARIASGKCQECYGRGAYDDPPWGIVQCQKCNGTGRAAPTQQQEGGK